MDAVVTILGPVTIGGSTSSDGAVGPAGAALSAKLRLLLAVLAARRGEVVSFGRLCDVLWGDEPPDGAAATLQSHVSRLRRLLEPAASVVSVDRGYRLDVADGGLDVDHFVRLVDRAAEAADPTTAASLLDAALRCWRGPAFGEVHDSEWIRPEAVRLDELRLSATESWFERRLEAGGDATLVGDLESACLAHPLRERFVRQLMMALFRDGRQADALRRGSQARRHLRDETGTEPTAAFVEIERQVLAGDPELLHADRAPAPVRRVRRRVADGPTRLVGRAAEATRTSRAVRTVPLVTLLGPGGVGKTRLARHVAAAADDFADGAVFVELAAVGTADSLADAVATALDVQPHQHLSIDEALLGVLAEQHRLVVFDNCEHLLDTIVPFVDRVRVLCPRVHVLATSREPLGLPGEVVVPVAPLAVSAAGDVDADAIAAAPAVELLVERVADAVPGFAITPDNAAGIAEICRRLDGLPLALELVAAQFRSLPLDAIVRRMDRPAAVLDTSMRSVDARHRTLRDTVAWSYDLLAPHEQSVFVRLSVFAGSFELEAVESVCASAVGDRRLDVVSALASLVDKSMVQVVHQPSPRYALLETLREFAREQLVARGLDDEARASHLAWFVGLAERASVGITGPDEAAWTSRCERDVDDLRLAFGHAVRSGDLDAAVRIVVSLREFAFRRIRYELFSWASTVAALSGATAHPRWPVIRAIVAYGHFVRGNLAESIDEALAAHGDAAARGDDTSGLAERTLLNALFYQGEMEAALTWGDRMVESSRSGSAARQAHALYMRSVAETSVGRPVKGAILAGEASAMARVCGGPTALAQASYALGLALEASDPTESLRLLRESAQVARAAGNRWVEAFADTEVWWLEARNGDVRTALQGSGVVVDTWSRGGDWANLRLSLRRVFALLTQVGDHRAAALLHGALTASGATSALPFEPNDVRDAGNAVAELREALGDDGFQQAVSAGAMLNETELVHVVQSRISAAAAS